MNNLKNDSASKNVPERRDRRELLVTGLGLVATSLLPHGSASAQTRQPGLSTTAQHDTKQGHRKLGTLEVSALGFGCMNVAGSTTGQSTSKRRSN
jgi:hypothetical protein